MSDPRHAQIGVLAGLLAYGSWGLGLAWDGRILLTYAGVALGVQWLLCRLRGVPFDPRSPLISALSLGLLLHTASPGWAGLAAAVASASKFLLRIGGRHVFNPTNLAIVAVILFTDRAWVAPGQWGLGGFLLAAAACAGLWVLARTRRAEASWAFLLAWAGLLFGRAAWLGDPAAIPLLQLQNVSLLIFACFMLSDPMTLPDHHLARTGFAVLVAVVGVVLQYGFYINEGPFYALAVCAPLVPWLNRRLPGVRYQWPRSPTSRR